MLKLHGNSNQIMLKLSFYFIIILFFGISCQKKVVKTVLQKSNYQFKSIKENPAMPIATQDNTGTCWAFAMTSFLESEIIRKTGKKIDLSEMYMVRNAFLEKAYISIMRHGQLPIGEGALYQDVIIAMDKYGIIPFENYPGLIGENKHHDHREMNKKIVELIPKYTKIGTSNGKWKKDLDQILDNYLGKIPSNFVIDSRNFTPKSFQKSLGIQPEDYFQITSFKHKPFYKNIVLDLEWNLSNEPFFNLPIDEFVKNLDHAIDNGFTVAVELDVSEPTYSGEYGIAVIPDIESDTIKILYEPLLEKQITQEYRQQEFENFHTYNDHNQQIVGKVVDQNGKVYYKAKNSWAGWGRDGYIYLSEAYIKLKVLYFTVHKDGLLGETKKLI
jgi:bleomycin hydrolase